MTQGTKDMLAIGALLALPLVAIITHKIYEFLKKHLKKMKD